MRYKNKKNFLSISILLLGLFCSSFVYSIQVAAIPKQIIEEVKNPNGNTSQVIKDGVFLLYIPKKKVTIDEFQISRDGKRIATVRPIKDIQQIKEATKEQYKVYEDYFGVKDIEDLANKILSYNQQFVFLGVYSKELRNIMGIVYEDFSPGGKKRKYKVTSIKSGQVVETGDSQLVEIGRYPVIPAPKDIKIEEGNQVIHFTWQKTKEQEKVGVIAYNIYFSKEKDKNFQLIPEGKISAFASQSGAPQATIKKSVQKENKKARRRKLKEKPQKQRNPNEFTYTLRKLDNDIRYFFKVKSVNIAEMESNTSKLYTAIPRNTQLPDKVEIISVEPRQGLSAGAIVTWEPLLNTENLSHYEVFRSEDNKKSYQKVSPSPIPNNKNEFADSYKFTIGKDYWYKVVGVNKQGQGGIPSTELSYTPDVKFETRRINVIDVKRKTNSLLIKFKPLNKNDRLMADGYSISRKDKIDGRFSTIAKISDLDKNSYLDTKVKSGITYCYIVLLQKTNGEFSKPGRESCNSPKIAVKLYPPISLEAYPDQAGIVVKWSVKQERFLSGFLVYRKSSKEKKFVVVTDFPLAGKERRYIDKNIEEGVGYTYYIRSVGKGNLLSDPSSTTFSKREIRIPSRPKNLVIYKKDTKRKNQFYLKWNHFDQADYFLVYMNKVGRTLGKKVRLGKTKKKEITFRVPKKGNYQVYIIANRKGVNSIESDKKRFSLQ